MKEQVIWTIVASAARRRRNAASGTMKLEALPIHGSRTLDRKVIGLNREDQPDVAIIERRVSAQRNCIGCVILLAICASEQLPLSGDVQRHVTLHLNRADHKYTRGHENRSTLVLVAGIDRRLDRGGIETNAVALRTKVTNVVCARAEIVAGAAGGRLRSPHPTRHAYQA